MKKFLIFVGLALVVAGGVYVTQFSQKGGDGGGGNVKSVSGKVSLAFPTGRRPRPRRIFLSTL